MKQDFDRINAALALVDSAVETSTLPRTVMADNDHHRNTPRGSADCLYGLIGDIALAASETTEANAHAVALNAISYLSAAMGRRAFLRVGNTNHHARFFGMHVGRSGRGRKGDALGIVHRLDMALRKCNELASPQVHRGGLSTREGLAMLIHDEYTEGKNTVEAIADKRLWVVESELANVLQQTRREGNTLSSGLRDLWDGISLRPATKTSRVWATDPHVCLSAAITPSELRSLMSARELSNGFANRFLIIWAERTKVLPFPKATPQNLVDVLAERVLSVLEFADATRFAETDKTEVTLTPRAAERYAELYVSELDDQSAGERVTALLERRAPTLLRLAMLFALTDGTLQIDVVHINAALAWVRFWVDSVKFVFASDMDEVATTNVTGNATRIVEFLRSNSDTTRSQLIKVCFQGHASKSEIDAAIDQLLTATPPQITVRTLPRPVGAPGSPTKVYCLVANSANSANREQRRTIPGNSQTSDLSELCEAPDGWTKQIQSTVRRIRVDSEFTNTSQPLVGSDDSQSSHESQAALDCEEF